MGSHPSQEGATGICVNSSPIMTMKAAVSTQLPELLALVALWPEAGSPGVFREVVGAAIHRSVKAVFIDKIYFVLS